MICIIPLRLLVGLLFIISVTGKEIAISSQHSPAPLPPFEASVQVTSVTLEPPSIHISQKPNTATVVVQIMLRGQAPSDPKAVVEVGTYSSEPPGDNIKYENPTRTVLLQKGITVVKFKAVPIPETRPGKLVVAASISGATKGITINDPPESPKDWHADLTILPD